MAKTMMTVTGERFHVKNTFIDGPACDADAAADEMRRHMSEPHPQRPDLYDGECNSRPRCMTDIIVIASSIERDNAMCQQTLVKDFGEVTASRERSYSSASTCASLCSDSDPHSWASSACDIHDEIAEVGVEVEVGVATTIVAKNIPTTYTKNLVLELLNGLNLKGKYDFVYLPVDFGTRKSFGYAFINFITYDDALQFKQAFDGFLFCAGASLGLAEWSGSLQGFQKHVERYQDSPMMHKTLPDDVKPSIFKDGEQIAFPPPTKVLKVPRRVCRRPPTVSGAAKNNPKNSTTAPRPFSQQVLPR